MKKFLFYMIFSGFLFAKPLIVGMELDYPPFEMSDKNGTPTGISVDLIKAYGKWANREIEIKNIAWTGLIPALRTGKIDLIISSMTISKARKKVVDFTIPYAKSNLSILTQKDSKISSAKDLNYPNIRISVKKGSTGHLYAVKHFPNAKIFAFDKQSNAILEVLENKTDVFLYDQMTNYKIYRKHPDKLKVLLKAFIDVPEYWGIAVRKGDDDLRNSLNKFIEISKKNGLFDKVGNKYVKDIKDAFKELNVEFFL